MRLASLRFKPTITARSLAGRQVPRLTPPSSQGQISITAPPGGDLPQPRTDPEDIAPFVAYLASDAAANINGQTFLVKGGIISLLNYPSPARTIIKPGRWTPEEIAVLFPSTLGMDLGNPAPRKD